MFKFKNILYILITIFIGFNVYAKENFILNWDKLIPENAYDFIPKDGGTDEMWQERSFLKKNR